LRVGTPRFAAPHHGIVSQAASDEQGSGWPRGQDFKPRMPKDARRDKKNTADGVSSFARLGARLQFRLLVPMLHALPLAFCLNPDGQSPRVERTG